MKDSSSHLKKEGVHIRFDRSTRLFKTVSSSTSPLNVSEVKQAPAVETQPSASAPAMPPSRQGKKAITGHFDPVVSRQLRQLALDNDITVQALLQEALNDLFVKHKCNPIA